MTSDTQTGRPPARPAGPPPRRASMAAPLIKSVIFIAVTALATAMLAISIANSGVTGTAATARVFTDVTGLIVGYDVDIAGVRVGQVTSISVYRRDLAVVGFSVQPGRAAARLRSTAHDQVPQPGRPALHRAGPGRGPGGPDAAGRAATIPLAQTTPALNLTELFNGFQPLFQALSPGDVNQLSSEIIQVLQGEGPHDGQPAVATSAR